MNYDKDLIAHKLRRWEKYQNSFQLPQWEEIPDLGLYMEQVITLIKGYLDYFPPELKEEQVITASTINNYVRTKIMPEPRKKKYYRVHIAYLIIICTLKQSLSIATLQKLIPMGISEEEVQEKYSAYVRRHRQASDYFVGAMRLLAAKILDHREITEVAVEDTEDLITKTAIISGLTHLLAEKLLLLEGQDLETVAAHEEGKA